MKKIGRVPTDSYRGIGIRSKFQRRHYEAIADVLKVRAANTCNGTCYRLTILNDLSDMFEQDNPHFKRDRFLSATED